MRPDVAHHRQSCIEADALDWNETTGQWSTRTKRAPCMVVKESSASTHATIVCGWDGEGEIPTDEAACVKIDNASTVEVIAPNFLTLQAVGGAWVGFAFAQVNDLRRFQQQIFEVLAQPESSGGDSTQVFFFSVALNRLDSSVRRGACIKAIGIVTTHRFFRVFEPFMKAALSGCFNELPSSHTSPTRQGEGGGPADAESERTRALNFNEKAVETLLHRLNATNVVAPGGGVRAEYPFSLRYMLRRTALNDSLRASQATSAAAAQVSSTADLAADATLLFHAVGDDEDHDNTPSSAKVSLIHDPEELSGASVESLVQKFGGMTAAIWRAVLERKRILFVGDNLSAGDVGNAVLSTCVLTRPLQNQLSRAFPYVNLQHLDDLLATPGFIAGTSNPIFKTHPQWWDILCDLNSGEVVSSPHSPLFEGETSSEKSPSSSKRGQNSNDAQGFDAIPSKYIDRCLSDALVAGEVDKLGEEWLRDCCFAVTHSVLSATVANRGALRTTTQPSPSAIRSRAILWGDFGVQSAGWNLRPTASIKTRAQLVPVLVQSPCFRVFEMVVSAREHIDQRWKGRDYARCLPQTTSQTRASSSTDTRGHVRQSSMLEY